MVKRVVDMDATYAKALGRKRAFGDEKKGIIGFTISKTNEERLAAARHAGESFDEALTRILDDYEKSKNKGETEECIFLS
jgi:hypothetical protein